jgi:hypothetical protein
MWDVRNSYKILVVSPQCNSSFERSRRKEYNTKMNLQKYNVKLHAAFSLLKTDNGGSGITPMILLDPYMTVNLFWAA